MAELNCFGRLQRFRSPDGQFIHLQTTMPKQYLYFFIVFNLVILNKPLAQNTLTDTGFYSSAINHRIDLYIDSVKENLLLYNGTEFRGASRRNKGHQFFEYPEPQNGDVF